MINVVKKTFAIPNPIGVAVVAYHLKIPFPHRRALKRLSIFFLSQVSFQDEEASQEEAVVWYTCQRMLVTSSWWKDVNKNMYKDVCLSRW